MNTDTDEKMLNPIVNRDISWLSFNYRVLQEAKDESVPLFERIKFLGIYSSNLDEFYRVRVASLQSLVKLNKTTRQEIDFDPEEILEQIREIVHYQQIEFTSIYQKQILPALQKQGINILRLQDLSETHLEELDTYVEEILIQYIQPILMVKGKIRTFLRNNALYLVVILETTGQSNRYALVRIPTDSLARFIELGSPDGISKNIILLDDIVRHALPSLFPGYIVKEAYSIKLTRGAELQIDDEYSGNLVEKIKRSLSKRNVGIGTRFVYDRKMPANCLDFVVENFDLQEQDLHAEGRYHNNFDFFRFPNFGRTELKDMPLPPIKHPTLHSKKTMFQLISNKDHLVHYPYQRYDYIIRLLEQAAQDPSVVRIKITQYRVAKNSQILSALASALQAGKEVVVFVEVKARFDEEANLSWAEKLEEWGAKVLYSLPEVKVHAKLCMVTRIENKKERNYCYLSTGNFNENTALLYTDYGFFTADPRITNDVASIFHFLENAGLISEPCDNIIAGRRFARKSLYALIDQEIKNAKAGLPAAIEIKINSLQDRGMIEKFYEASRAGVNIRMIVRGICCLIPQLPGVSDNIQIISVIDRFLEHTRVYSFLNHGKERKLYLGSSDLMTRNIDHRIECIFPIYDKDLQAQIYNEFETLWRDNQKARIVDKDRLNNYVQAEENAPQVRGQIALYNYYQNLAPKK